MFVPFAGFRLLQALQQPLRVGWHPQQIGRLLKCRELLSGQQHGVATSRGDLDRNTVVIHLLDQREQLLARLTGTDGHLGSSARWYNIIVPVSDVQTATSDDVRAPR